MDKLSEITTIIVTYFCLILEMMLYEVDGIRLHLLKDEQFRVAAVEAMERDKIALLGLQEEIAQLYRYRDFKGLTSFFENTQLGYKRGDPFVRLLFGLKFFENGDVSLYFFDTWVRTSPDSWVPFVARAEYFIARGWQSRGSKWTSETSASQITSMQNMFLVAEEDLTKAIALDPSVVVSYMAYLEIAQNGIGELTKEDILALVIEQDPGAYYFWYQYLQSQQTKWGGSSSVIRSAILQAQSYRDTNPRLYGLIGFEYELEAYKSRQQQDYTECVRLFGLAFEYSDLYNWRNGRASCYGKLGERAKQIADLEAVARDNDYTATRRKIAEVYVELGQIDAAINHIKQALLIDASSPSLNNYLGWLYEASQRPDLAVEAYLETLKYAPQDSYATKRLAELDLI